MVSSDVVAVQPPMSRLSGIVQEPPKKVTERILSAVYKVSERPKKKPKTPASVSREQISVNKGILCFYAHVFIRDAKMSRT